MNLPEIFAVGSPWFWLLIVAEAALLIALIEWGKGLMATLSLVAVLVAVEVLGNADLLGFASHHPLLLVFGTLGYFALGTVWSVARWWMYVRNERSRYDEARAEFCHDYDVDGPIPESLQETWRAFLEGRKRKIEIRPRVRQHKRAILTWMSYWPCSLFWTMLNDPVRKAFQIIYRHTHDYFQQISNNAFQGVDADFGGTKNGLHSVGRIAAEANGKAVAHVERVRR